MAYLRCSDCGAKALQIATRCPSCGSTFPLYDERGERIRFRRCRGCDIHIPRQEARCRWCSTEVQHLPWRPAAAAAVLVLLLSGGGLFLARTPGTFSSSEGPPDVQAEASPAPRPEPSSPPRPGLPDATGSPFPTPDGNVAPPDPRQGVGQDDVQGGGQGSWAAAQAVTFVNVRANPDREAAILGVVPEAASVLLGDLRGGWRRIRAGDLSGWVDGRLFQMASSGD